MFQRLLFYYPTSRFSANGEEKKYQQSLNLWFTSNKLLQLAEKGNHIFRSLDFWCMHFLFASCHSVLCGPHIAHDFHSNSIFFIVGLCRISFRRALNVHVTSFVNYAQFAPQESWRRNLRFLRYVGAMKYAKPTKCILKWMLMIFLKNVQFFCI